MSITVKKSSALAAAALAAGFAMLPVQEAEARWHGRHGAGVAAGLIGAAIIGGALLSRPAYGYPAYGGPVYVEGPECYIVRRKVWDDYRGRWVRVRQRVCD